jgi:DNA-directed RNA polymerase subunit RPC12/RpoP
MTQETTIQFNCPQCGQVCAFKSIHAGRSARCLKCNARFVIPSQNNHPAQLFIAPPAAPLPGFYANAIKGGIKAFAHRGSIVGLVFCTALVVFHFALGNVDLSFTLGGFRPPLAIGWVTTLVTFGLFSWYCLETILHTYLGIHSLPSVEPGAGFEFLAAVFKSCYLFPITLIVALLPASLISAAVEFLGIPLDRFYYGLAALCLLLWPMNLAIIALNVPMWRVFRYDLLIKAIAGTFVPYLFTALITLTAFFVAYLGMAQFATDTETPPAVLIELLLLRIAGAWLFLFAMRIIGVYVLHYGDLCPDLWTTPSPVQASGED